MGMQNPFQRVIDQLNLEAAVRRGTVRNDLLPPRYEDLVTGEVGKRFSDGLQNRLERGRYDPTPASYVLVPKPGNTTRPAALLTLPDRVGLRCSGRDATQSYRECPVGTRHHHVAARYASTKTMG